MAWNNTPAKTFARLNTLRMTPDNLREQWANERVEARMVSYPWLGPVVFYELTKHPSIAGMNTFRGGGFYVQDPSTVLAVSLLSPQRSDRILDTCAAPGGKATLMAQLVENEGLIIARDTEESRMRQLRENCARLGAKSQM